MKAPLKLFIISIIASASADGYAFPELPFCPAGGPPGWMNHFNFKRDQNNWRHYYQNTPPVYRQRPYYRSDYTYRQQPVFKRPLNFSSPPYNDDRNQYRTRPSPSRTN